MRMVDTALIADEVARMCVQSNKALPLDIVERLQSAFENETSELAKKLLSSMMENITLAEKHSIPVCQDTGMVVVFLDIGQEVQLSGALPEDAVNEGIRRAYTGDFLRCSVAADPVRRGNTGDNTPAIVHTRIVAGDKVTLTVAPKGCGSENMSGHKMLKPTASAEDIIAEVAAVAEAAGGNPCPPMVIGVGIGGNFEQSAILAKRALCRPLNVPNPDLFYAGLEKRMLSAVNALDIGVQGFGGATTALGVNIEWAPTHIAGLPLAVNIGCYVTRHMTAVI